MKTTVGAADRVTEGIDLVVMPYHDYRKNEIEGFRGRDSHFLEMLIAKSNHFRTILVIDRPVTLVEQVVLGRSWHVMKGTVVQRGRDWRLTQVDRNVFVLNHLSMALIEPVRLGLCWWDKAFASNRFASISGHVFETLSLQNAVVLLHHPFGIQLLKRLPYRSLLFDVVDNFFALNHFKAIHASLERHYKDIGEKAAQIFSVTEMAASHLFGHTGNITVLPNAVSPEFIRVPVQEHPVGLLKHILRPVIGYVGSLSEHFDTDLLTQVGTSLPNYSFVIAGTVGSTKHFQKLKRLKNVHFVGAVPYRMVPALLRDFDICIAPYVFGGDLAQGGESIKLYEYVAADKPVVTTPVPGADRFSDYIRIARNSTEFAAAIRSFVDEGSFSGYPSGLLEGLTWQDRFKPLMEAIFRAGYA